MNEASTALQFFWSNTNLSSDSIVVSQGALAYELQAHLFYRHKVADSSVYYFNKSSDLFLECNNPNKAFYNLNMASTISFYDSKNLAVGVALNADKGRYFDNYTLQEDAYRILLSTISSQLTKAASLTLKVEIMGLKGTSADATVLASGELPMKVTDESYNIQNLNCRCGKAGMTDAAIIKEVKEAFEFQFNDIKEVYKVVLLDRDFTMNYDNSYPTKLVTSKGMWANIVYKNDKDIYMMVKRYIFFKKDGAGFSSKATIGKHKFYLPVSPTCSK